MVIGYGIFARVARTALRTSPSTALCCLVLSSCGGRDETWATGIPDTSVAGESPSQKPDEPPPEVTAREPDAGAGVEPVGEETDEPVTVRPNPPLDAGTTPDAAPPSVAFDCTTVPAAPVSFETLEGFAPSEDFVFDELGNYVGIDDNGNLVRVSKTGEKQLWYPSVAAAAGMAILPDGSAIICDVREGALKRVYLNGAISVVLGGLLYPNGVDVGPDGFIYVAENAVGRVRRVNPDTGEFSVVALGLHGPNGVAFSNDPALLYVGSFEGSGVYKVELPGPGELGHASVFARPNGSTLREPIIACPDAEEGADCETEWYGPGKCQALANVVDCLPIDSCVERPDGAECSYPAVGSCQAGQCVELPNPCDGFAAGAPCEDPNFGTGVCGSSFGELYCEPPDPCEGLELGDACEDPFFGAGVCERLGNDLNCAYPEPCEGKSEGDACEAFGVPGECVPDLEYLYCTPVNPCEDGSVGDACEDPFFGEGECAGEGEALYCSPLNVCEELTEGAPCSDYFTEEGTCVAFEEGLLCTPPNACDDLIEGASCSEFGFEGICVYYQEHLYCGYPDVCDSLTEGAPCSNEFITDGVCADQDGRLVCTPPNPCDGLTAAAACSDPYTGVVNGFCADRDGQLVCTPPNPCDGLSAGASCTDPNTGVGVGVCTDDDGSSHCASVACSGLEDGASCEDPLTGRGQCFFSICMPLGGPGGAGGVDGMGVDACGNVYATEYTSGNVWRISPAGEIELLVVLPSSWIPNVKWGRDLGGFSSQVMYVADREKGRLFGVAVGVPGATEFYASQP